MKNPIKSAVDAIRDALTPVTTIITDSSEDITPEETPEVLHLIDSVVDGNLVKLLGSITDEPVEGAKLVKIPDANGALVHKYFKAK